MATQEPRCLFCRIVAGEIPSARVHEDEATVAFLDIGPLQPGHVLVVPREHHARLTDIPPATMAAIGQVLPRIARGVLAATGAEGLNLHQANGECAGQVVPHAHFHLIPRRRADGIRIAGASGTYGPGELDAWRKKIAAAVASA